MSLQTLDLSYNDIGAEGCLALAAHALGKAGCLMSLQTLDLSINGIGAEGCLALAEHALGKAGCLMSLQTLDLSNNDIGDEGKWRICDLVRANHAASVAIAAGSPRPQQPRRRTLSPVQADMRRWRKASKTRRKTIPWRSRQRASDLADRARLQHMTHRVCDAVLVTGEWSRVRLECAAAGRDGWSSSAVSTLRRHGGLSVVAAGRAVLGGDAGRGVVVEMLEKHSK
jgi:hypothetical protein